MKNERERVVTFRKEKHISILLVTWIARKEMVMRNERILTVAETNATTQIAPHHHPLDVFANHEA